MTTFADRFFARCNHGTADLQTRSDAPAASGGTTETYTTLAMVPVRIVVKEGSIYLDDRQTEVGVTHEITTATYAGWKQVKYIRGRDGEWSGRRFRVHRVREVGPGGEQFQIFLCEEIKSGI